LRLAADKIKRKARTFVQSAPLPDRPPAPITKGNAGLWPALRRFRPTVPGGRAAAPSISPEQRRRTHARPTPPEGGSESPVQPLPQVRQADPSPSEALHDLPPWPVSARRRTRDPKWLLALAAPVDHNLWWASRRHSKDLLHGDP